MNALNVVLVRYLHPADHHQTRIRAVDKDLARELDFKISHQN